MERKLATIRVISDIRPIEGADMIELATVGGWNIVVAKNVGHKVGDHVVYCEIDSFLPIKEEFEFLRKSSYKKMGDQEGFRLKTIKLRGQVSQGLILPMSVFGDFSWTAYEGLDVTNRLGIIKYEPPIPAELSGKIKGGFPSFLHKTDEERVQNLVKEYGEYKFTSTHQFYMTEKLDGSSATFYMNEGEFGVCSRNLELLETEGNTFWKVARELDLENKLKDKGNICLQGELIGEGIQGNPYKIKGQNVHFFNAFDIDKQTRLGINEFLVLLDDMELVSVPILDVAMLLPDTVKGMLELAEGKSRLNDKTEREGVVVRSLDNTISFKAISNKFLLSEK